MSPEIPPHSPLLPAASARPRNRWDRQEWAGAFGDLGTLIPFLVAYLGVVRMDPVGVLVAFGLAMVASGLYYRTPVPVQPMKAIGAAAALHATQAAAITPEAVWAAALASGVFWLLLGVSGAATRVARWVPAPVVAGITLGLGFGFMVQGTQLMRTGWLVAVAAGVITLLLLRSRRFPAMFALLAFGAMAGAWQQPQVLAALGASGLQLRLPEFVAPRIGSADLLVGVLLLALPQVPLTLGNAVIALTEENNRRFPQAPVSVRRVAIGTGLMNLVGGAFGGVPQCHGVGGMAGHVAFGARTGGAVVILGGLLLVLALGFGDAVQHLLQLLPQAVLGVILFLAGVQLARGALPPAGAPAAALVTIATAGIALWNVAAAFVVGCLLWQLAQRGRLEA